MTCHHTLRRCLILILTSGLLIAPLTASAVIIADYQMNNAEPLAASDDGTSWTTSDATSGFEGFSSTTTDYHAYARENDLPETGVDTLNAWQFTVTPDTGSPLAFEQFYFNYYSQIDTTITASLRSSLTGSTDLDSLQFGQTGSNPTSPTDFLSHTFDLTGITALQNVSDPVTFSVHLSVDPTGTGGSPVRFDDFQLSATVIPEPTPGLLIMAVAGVLLLRRRR